MYKALKSFSGVISMAEGDIKDISNPIILKDLVKAGYIEEVKPAETKAKKKKTAEAETETLISKISEFTEIGALAPKRGQPMNVITKVSDITYTDVGDYLRLTPDLLEDPNNIAFITSSISIAKAYISNYTGIAEADLDNYGDFPLVVLALCQDMYDNRSLYVDNTNLNTMVETILGLHQTNLL